MIDPTLKVNLNSSVIIVIYSAVQLPTAAFFHTITHQYIKMFIRHSARTQDTKKFIMPVSILITDLLNYTILQSNYLLMSGSTTAPAANASAVELVFSGSMYQSPRHFVELMTDNEAFTQFTVKRRVRVCR